MRVYRSLGIAALVAAGTAPAWGQEGIITVELRNVSGAIATNLRADESKLPGTVQLPIGAAAQVCGIEPSVLAQRGAGASCVATTTSASLDQAVQRQVRDNNGAHGDAKEPLGSGTQSPSRTDKGKGNVPPGTLKKDPSSERSR